MELLDGKATADKIKNEIAIEVQKIASEGGKIPHLAAILVGDDGASQTYVGHKEKACAQVGFKSTLLRFPADISEERLLSEIDSINKTLDSIATNLKVTNVKLKRNYNELLKDLDNVYLNR